VGILFYFSHCCLSVGKFMTSENKCSRDLCSWVNEFLLRFPFPRLYNAHVLQLPLTHSSSSLTFIQNTVRTLSFPHMLLTTHVNLALGSLTYAEDLTLYTKKMISSYVPYNDLINQIWNIKGQIYQTWLIFKCNGLSKLPWHGNTMY
jgi:hypothetical protein